MHEQLQQSIYLYAYFKTLFYILKHINK